MSELSDRLGQIVGLTLESKHIGLTTWDTGGNNRQLCDEWRITLSYIKVGDTHAKEYTTTYRTGIGHRKVMPGVKRERGGYATLTESPKNTEEACKRGWLKVVYPNIADVLSCLLSDASSGEETFYDWASNLGYDTDSRNALDTYLACQKTLVALRHVLGYELFSELKGLEH